MDFIITTTGSSSNAAVYLPRKLLGLEGNTEPQHLPSSTVALYVILCILFVCGSGLAAGLTLGLMSLDQLDMQVLLRSGAPKQQQLAKRILPILADPHWLLVTLLLCNAGCFEALPIFLDVLVDPLGAILISITLILIFGEILPQAVCARYGLEIGSALGWLVRIMMWLTCPISWPLARMLDWMLGKEGYSTFKRPQLKALVDLHGADEGLGGKLSDDEVQIICGALDLTNKIAYSVMTPLDKVVMLSTDQKIDRETVHRILASGHSRIPVYQGHNRRDIIGLILVKELLAHTFPDTWEGTLRHVVVSQLNIRSLPRLPANTRCYDMLKLFRTGRAHMTLLTQPLTEASDTAGPSHPAPTNTAMSSKRPTEPGAAYTSVATLKPPVAAPHTPGDALPPAGPHSATSVSDLAKPSWSHHPDAPTPTHTPPLPVSTLAGQHSISYDTPLQRPSANTAQHTVLVPSSPDGASDAQLLPGQQPSSLSAGLARLSARLTSWRSRSRRASAELGGRASLSSESTRTSVTAETEVEMEVPQIALPGEPIGIITIEDVLEELMGQEILDETDPFADNEQTLPVDEDMRLKLAERLPERLRVLVLGNASNVLKRLSRTSGGASNSALSTRGSMSRLNGLELTPQSEVTGNKP